MTVPSRAADGARSAMAAQYPATGRKSDRYDRKSEFDISLN